MHLTITGDLCSGKSTVANVLCTYLNFPKFSIGEIFKKYAYEHDMELVDVLKNEEIARELDDKVDNECMRLGNQEKPYVFDARLAWYFVHNSFKVYVIVDENEAIKRFKSDEKRKENGEKSQELEEIFDSLKERRAIEERRFKEQYAIDFTDLGQYDLVVDSTNLTVDETALKILEGYKEFVE